jgi:hypothetical protein
MPANSSFIKLRILDVQSMIDPEFIILSFCNIWQRRACLCINYRDTKDVLLLKNWLILKIAEAYWTQMNFPTWNTVSLISYRF